MYIYIYIYIYKTVDDLVEFTLKRVSMILLNE